MTGIKSLAKDTAIYGLSSIVGKFLNWLLVPFYSYTLKETGDYGMVTELYGWTALALVILTYGMETGFFRFINNDKYKSTQVYSTSLSMLGLTSLLFVAVSLIFLPQISAGMGYEKHPEFIGMLVVVVAADAFCSIPFAYLRYKNKALRFASIKLLMILTNIFFTLFFFWLCTRLSPRTPLSSSSAASDVYKIQSYAYFLIHPATCLRNIPFICVLFDTIFRTFFYYIFWV